jgi:3-hydroxy-3-methylglutaryl CoA synthase
MDKFQQLLQKHITERLELSALQAQDMLNYYKSIEDFQQVEQWAHAVKHRQNLLTSVTQDGPSST